MAPRLAGLIINQLDLLHDGLRTRQACVAFNWSFSMKIRPVLGAIACAVLAVASVSTQAATDLGLLAPATPISFSQDTLADAAAFTNVYNFHMDNPGSFLIGVIGSVYSDASSKISAFNATLKNPSNVVVNFDYDNLPDVSGSGFQYLSQGFAAAPAGNYVLTVSGTTAAYAATYSVDLSVSAVPEPATVMMLLAGLAVVGVAGNRRKSA